MYRLFVQPAAGELAYGDAWELAPDVTVAVTGVALDEYETASGATRTRLAIAVELQNGSEEPFEFVNEFGLSDGAGGFRRHVWVDPAKRPQALGGVRPLAPGERAAGEVYVSVEPSEAHDEGGATDALFIPAFGGLIEHNCQGCSGHDQHEFMPRAMWQPVLVAREPSAARS